MNWTQNLSNKKKKNIITIISRNTLVHHHSGNCVSYNPTGTSVQQYFIEQDMAEISVFFTTKKTCPCSHSSSPFCLQPPWILAVEFLSKRYKFTLWTQWWGSTGVQGCGVYVYGRDYRNMKSLQVHIQSYRLEKEKKKKTPFHLSSLPVKI